MKKSIFDIQHQHLSEYLQKIFPAGKLAGNEFTIGDITGKAGESLKFNIEKGCGQDFSTGQIFGSIVEIVKEKYGLEEQAAFRKIEDDWGVNTNVVSLAAPAKKKEIKQITFSETANPLTIPGNFSTKYGDPTGRWVYKNAEGAGIGWVVRFDTPEGKQYFPFVFGEDQAWHSKGFTEPRPLYDLPEVIKSKNIILIVEGEKAAEAAKQIMPSLTPTTWVGGASAVKKTDWTPLQGKKVLIWRDNDEPGQIAETKLAEILSDLGCIVRVFQPDAFKDRPKGWDIADLLNTDEMDVQELQQWTKFNIIEYQRGGADSSGSTLEVNKSAHVYEEPLNQHFRPLGMGGNKFLLYNYHSGRVEEKTSEGFTESFCRVLVRGDTNYWRGVLRTPKGEKIAWKAIGGILSSDFYKLGQFDTDRIRGLGCWLDNKRIVFNAGDYLYVEGRKIPINEFESYYVYIRSEDILPTMDNEISRYHLGRFEELCNMFAWEYPACGTLLAGWLMVAPICGALKWRPHIYITGMSGTGKSTIYENILARTLGRCTTAALGDSTKAGLAQSGKIDALPIIFDEIENDSKADEMRNDTVLRMARHSSSSQRGKSLKGRADQSGAEEYTCRSAFCFSSITPSVKHYADYTRITLLPLIVDHSPSKEAAIQHFEKITGLIAELMGDDAEDYGFSETFITYATRNVQNITASYKILKPLAQSTLSGFTSRIADQIGMLLAGYWAYKSDKPITREEAGKLLLAYNWEDLIPNKKQENQIQLLSKLTQHRITIKNEEKDDQRTITRTVADMVEYISYTTGHKDDFYYPKDKAIDILANIGIKYKQDQTGIAYVLIANNSEELKRLLAGTQWAVNWHHSLKAVPGAVAMGTTWFSKAVGTQRCTMVPLKVFISNEEEALALDLTSQ